MEGIINLRLLSHPVNWGIVWVVLGMGALAMHQLHVSRCDCQSPNP
jgi:hypothetical protein